MVIFMVILVALHKTFQDNKIGLSSLNSYLSFT